MKYLYTMLASLRLTIAAILFLVITILVTYNDPGLSRNWIAIPLLLLGINLLVVILVSNGFHRQYGLLVFHLGLLLIIINSAVGLAVSFKGHVEVLEGQDFDPAAVITDHKGIWHHLHLDQVTFNQGSIQVDYAAALRREATRSQVGIPGENGLAETRIIGDAITFTVAGYRFLTSANKGFALILSWIDDQNNIMTGAIHLPSYPIYEWKQENQWNTPAGEKLTLVLLDNESVVRQQAWTLDNTRVNGSPLRIISERSGNALLHEGDILLLEGGKLRFDGIRMWLGYRIDYNPTLIWQLIIALIAISGLAFHFWQKFSSVQEKSMNITVHIEEDALSLRA